MNDNDAKHILDDAELSETAQRYLISDEDLAELSEETQNEYRAVLKRVKEVYRDQLNLIDIQKIDHLRHEVVIKELKEITSKTQLGIQIFLIVGLALMGFILLINGLLELSHIFKL